MNRIDRMSSGLLSARRVGHIMFGIAAFLVVRAVLIERKAADGVGNVFAAAAKSMAGDGAELVSRTESLSDGTKLEFLEIQNETGEPAGYAYHTEKIGGKASGYGGQIVLAVMLDRETGIKNLRIIRSRETPSYIAPVLLWMRDLTGRKLGGKDPLTDVDSVSGATITSDAIIRILQKSGRVFSGEVLGMEVADAVTPRPRDQRARFLFVVCLMALAFVARRRPTARVRQMFLILVLLVLGLHLNIQYSVAHVFSLLSMRVPPAAVAVPFLLVVIVPVLVLLFGNFYCGWLCPFGALQELIGRLGRFTPSVHPDRRTLNYGRLVKYAMLFVFVVLFSISLDSSLAGKDLLVTIFGGSRTHFAIAATVAILGLSIPYGRFWCRNLCPTGAFLSLLNRVRLLRKFIPAINPGLCEFGVGSTRELDCLCCDRCRLPDSPTPAAGPVPAKRNVIFMAAVLVLAGLLAREGVVAWRQGSDLQSAGLSGGVGSNARDVDMSRLRLMIDRQILSDHEARYYKTVPEIPAEE